jgi:hypothetical protein
MLVPVVAGVQPSASAADSLPLRTPTTSPQLSPRRVLDEGWAPNRHWVERADGTVSVEVYERAAFTESNGVWRHVDARPRLENGAVVSRGVSGAVRFGAAGSPALSFEVDGKNVTMNGVGMASRRPAIAGETVRYAGVAQDADLEYEPIADGVKERVVLRSASAPRSYRFHISDPGDVLGAPKRRPDGGWTFGEGTMALGAPSAYEQKAPAANPGSATIDVRPAGDGFDVVETVDPEWLKGKSFPIVLDPTVQTVTKTPADTYIVNGTNYADSNYDTDLTRDVGYGLFGTANVNAVRRTLLSSQAVTDAVPPGVTVRSAAVSMYATSMRTGTQTSITTYRISQSWTDSGATWNKSGVGTATWTGGAGVAISGAAAKVVSTVGTRHEFPITATAQAWVNGTTLSQGVMLRATNESTLGAVRFASSHAANSSQWPSMKIEYDRPVNGTWTQESPLLSPSTRSHHVSVYDPVRKNVVLFGGLQTNLTTYLADTWTWNGVTWTQAATTGAFGRAGASAAFDEKRGELVMFGGMLGNGGNTTTNYTDTWNGTSWTKEAPVDKPGGRESASMAYDPGLEKVVLFGGNINGGQWNDTWTWDGTNWQKLTPTTSPSARHGAAMAYLPSLGKIVMFGGIVAGAVTNETWTFDGSAWQKLTPAVSPAARSGATLTYDDNTKRLMLFGGSGYRDDTWVFDGTRWIGAVAPSDPAPSPRGYAPAAYDQVNRELVLFGGYDGGTKADTWTLTLTGPPDAPATVTATPGDKSASVSWAQANANGSAITSYTVTASPGGATQTTVGAVTSATFTGLTNGTEYTFKVKATNAEGTGPERTSNAVTPAGNPTPPTNVVAVAGNHQAALSWTAAGANGSDIVSYTVAANPPPSGSAATRTTTGPETTLTFDGLTNGVLYTFTVTAKNGVGTSSPSLPSNAVAPYRAEGPEAPVISSSTHDQDVWSAERDASFGWTMPEDADPAKGYSVEFDESPGTVPDAASDTLLRTWSESNVPDGDHWLHVRASDSAGRWGDTGHFRIRVDASGPAAPPVTSSTHPDETRAYGENEVALAWQAPQELSGITGYSWSLDDDAQVEADTTVDGQDLSYTYNDVADGTHYFHVRAQNGSGLWGATKTFAVSVHFLVGGAMTSGSGSQQSQPTPDHGPTPVVPELVTPPAEGLGSVLPRGGLFGEDSFFGGPVVAANGLAGAVADAAGDVLPPGTPVVNTGDLAKTSLRALDGVRNVVGDIVLLPSPVYTLDVVRYNEDGSETPTSYVFPVCMPQMFHPGRPDDGPTPGVGIPDMRVNFCPDVRSFDPADPENENHREQRATLSLDALTPGTFLRATVTYAYNTQQLRAVVDGRYTGIPVDDGGGAPGNDPAYPCNNTSILELLDGDSTDGYCEELRFQPGDGDLITAWVTSSSTGPLTGQELYLDEIPSGDAAAAKPVYHFAVANLPASPKHVYRLDGYRVNSTRGRIELDDSVANPGEGWLLEQFDADGQVVTQLRLGPTARNYVITFIGTVDENGELASIVIGGTQPTAMVGEKLSADRFDDGVRTSHLELVSFATSYSYRLSAIEDDEGRLVGVSGAASFDNGVPASGRMLLQQFDGSPVQEVSRLEVSGMSPDLTFTFVATGDPANPDGAEIDISNAAEEPDQVIRVLRSQPGTVRTQLVFAGATADIPWAVVGAEGRNLLWTRLPKTVHLALGLTTQSEGSGAGTPGHVSIGGTATAPQAESRLHFTDASQESVVGLVLKGLSPDFDQTIDAEGSTQDQRSL